MNGFSPFQGVFLMYLYVGSIAVIICIYIWVLVDSCSSLNSSDATGLVPPTITTSIVPDRERQLRNMSVTKFGSLKKAHISRDRTSSTSFYLRVGAIGKFLPITGSFLESFPVLINLFFPSFRFGHPRIQRSGDGNAFHDGGLLSERRRLRPSNPSRALYVPADAFSLRELTSSGGKVRSGSAVRVHAFGSDEPRSLDPARNLGEWK